MLFSWHAAVFFNWLDVFPLFHSSDVFSLFHRLFFINTEKKYLVVAHWQGACGLSERCWVDSLRRPNIFNSVLSLKKPMRKRENPSINKVVSYKSLLLNNKFIIIYSLDTIGFWYLLILNGQCHKGLCMCTVEHYITTTCRSYGWEKTTTTTTKNKNGNPGVLWVLSLLLNGVLPLLCKTSCFFFLT